MLQKTPSLSQNLIFALKGSYTDFIGGNIPSYSRPSPLWLDSFHNEELSIESFEAYHPAFLSTPDDISLYIEPSAINYVLNNQRFRAPQWYKGSSVQIEDNVALSPSGYREVDRITWVAGSQNRQLLFQEVSLIPGETYCLSAILRANNDTFTDGDRLTLFTGDATEGSVQDVAGSPISLSVLNDNLNRWQIIEGTFTVPGISRNDRILLPNIENSSNGVFPFFSILRHTNNTFTLSVNEPLTIDIPENSWQGAIFNCVIGQDVYGFEIIGNSFLSSQKTLVTISVKPTSNIDFIDIGNTGFIENPPVSLYRVGFYVESLSSLEVAGIQLERRDFRTSFIFQGDQIRPRSDTLCSYYRSPLKTGSYSIFLAISLWRGDGNVIDFGDWSIRIKDEALVFDSLNFLDVPLPQKSFKLLLEFDNVNQEQRLFVDGVLVRRSSGSIFSFSGDASVSLSSSGVRVVKELLVFRENIGFKDGIPPLTHLLPLNNRGEGLISEIFATHIPLDLEMLNRIAPRVVNLPPIVIPPRILENNTFTPIGINYIQNTLMLPLTEGRSLIQLLNLPNTQLNHVFTPPIPIFLASPLESDNQPVEIFARANLLSLSISTSTILTLDTLSGFRLGNSILFNYVDLQGRAIVRFPHIPLDLQVIRSLNRDNYTIIVDDVSSFSTGRVVVTTPNNQDVGEFVVLYVDQLTNTITLNSLDGIYVNDFIYRLKFEQLIDRENYFVNTLSKVEGVSILKTYSNGIIFGNNNSFPIRVEPVIHVFL